MSRYSLTDLGHLLLVSSVRKHRVETKVSSSPSIQRNKLISPQLRPMSIFGNKALSNIYFHHVPRCFLSWQVSPACRTSQQTKQTQSKEQLKSYKPQMLPQGSLNRDANLMSAPIRGEANQNQSSFTFGTNTHSHLLLSSQTHAPLTHSQGLLQQAFRSQTASTRTTSEVLYRQLSSQQLHSMQENPDTQRKSLLTQKVMKQVCWCTGESLLHRCAHPSFCSCG